MGWRDLDQATGGLDDFDFTVERAYFATSAEYNDGKSLLIHWEGTTEGLPEKLQEKFREFTVSFPVGKGWFSEDAGKTASHESGQADKNFHASSLYGRVINRAVEDFGLEDVLAGRGNPTEAKVWEGLRFHLKRETIDFGKGIEARERLMPSAYIGANGEANTASAAQQQVSNPKIVEAKLKKLARESSTHQEFVDQAMEIPGVADDDELLNRVVSEDGIYAESR